MCSTFRWIPWYERFDYLFAGIIKLDGMPCGVDHRICTNHKNIDIMSLSNKYENVFQTQEILTYLVIQTFAFGDGMVPPSSRSNTPMTRACKFPNVKGQPNIKLKNKNMKIDVGSSAIVDVIKEFSIVVNPNWKTQDGNDWKDQFTNVTKLITNYNYVCWCVEGQRN